MFYGKVIKKKISATLVNNAKKYIRNIKMSFWDEKEAKRLFQELSFIMS